MKKLIILLLLLSTNSAFGEYNGWYIDFIIKTTSHQTINGHAYVASTYFEKDSIKNKKYVLAAFDRLDNDGENGMITFFKHRINYYYRPFGSDETAVIYTLLDTQRVFIDSISAINITEMIDYWYLSGISTSHTLADTAWMKKPPVQSVIASGYLCSWEIFVHERSTKTDQILAELNAVQIRYKRILKQAEEGVNYIDEPEPLRDIEDQIDETTDEILQRFEGEKVVIVSFCSC